MVLWVIYVPALLPLAFLNTRFSLIYGTPLFWFSAFNSVALVVCVGMTIAAMRIGGRAKLGCTLALLAWGVGFLGSVFLMKLDMSL